MSATRAAPKIHSAREAWIQTHTCKQAHPLWLAPAEVCIEDIAHHLGNLCRWTGACSEFLSVAEHCLNVASVLPNRLKLYGLLHDAAEAYLSDIASPTKRDVALEGYRAAENRAEIAILQAFGLPELNTADRVKVKTADLRMLHTEALQLMQPIHPDFTFALPPYRTVEIRCLTPKQARAEYKRVFDELQSKRGKQ